MAWKKSPEWLVETFAELVPDHPRVERRKMFGYPCAFAQGNMFMGLHEDRLVLRLGDAARDRFREETGAGRFAPMEGREMKQYSVVPEALVRERRDELDPWIECSLRYVLEEGSLSPTSQKLHSVVIKESLIQAAERFGWNANGNGAAA